MAGVKGRSGTNRNKDKPYAEALRMELATAGDNLKALRVIARKHIEMAGSGDMQAINALADRLDGKPMQESAVTVSHARANELSDDELADIAVGSGEGAAHPPIDPSQLN